MEDHGAPVAKRLRSGKRAALEAPGGTADDPRIAQLQQAVTELRESVAHLQKSIESLAASSGTATAPAGSPVAPEIDAIVKLDVGGVRYTVARSTLTSNTNSMLASMFSGKYKLTYTNEGRVFIDRDGQLFNFVLAYLRNGRWRLPAADPQLMQAIRAEAEYFNLPWPDAELHIDKTQLVHVFDPCGSSKGFGYDIIKLSESTLLVLAADRLLVYRVPDGRVLRMLPVQDSASSLVRWGEDVLVVGSEADVCLVDTNTLQKKWWKHLEGVPEGAFLGQTVEWNQHLCSLLFDDHICDSILVWSEALREPVVLPYTGTHERGITFLATWGNKLAYADYGCVVWIVSEELQPIKQLQLNVEEGRDPPATVCHMTTWASQLCVATSDNVHVWNESFELVFTVCGFPGAIHAVAVWNDHLVVGGDSRLQFWDADFQFKGSVAPTTSGSDHTMHSIHPFSNRHLLTVGNSTIARWDGMYAINFQNKEEDAHWTSTGQQPIWVIP